LEKWDESKKPALILNRKVLASYITTLGREPVLPMMISTAIFADFFLPVSQWSQSKKLLVFQVVQNTKVKIIRVRIGTLTPEVVALLKGKSDSKLTRKASAKSVRRTAPKTRAKTETKVASRPTSKSAPITPSRKNRTKKWG
jgi:hypothetical protein